MQTSYMERSNPNGIGGGGGGGGRGKRGLDPSSADEGPDRKRAALSSIIVEALKVDSLQKMCSSLEPILRRVVSEEVERALAKLGPFKLPGRSSSSPKRIEGPDGRILQLQFRSRLSLPLFTGGKVEGEQGGAIHIVLIDATTGRVVTTGPESAARLDIVVLEGDFSNEDGDNWSQEEFDSHLVKEREGKRPLLTGELQVSLKDGVATLGELTFTDNSSWIRSRKFRLGLKVASGCCEGMRIREAKTDAFTVKDHRGELYKKHYPPSLNDEVWRLEKIGKDGSFHKRLNKAGIFTVEDFLRLVVRDSQRLRNILGSGMSNKMWDILIEHARTCVLSGKLYVYSHPEDARSVGVVFNNIHEFTGLIADGQYISSAESLSAETHKVYVDTLVKKAYENWMHVVEYDGKSLLLNQKPDQEDEAEFTTAPPLIHPTENHLLTQVTAGGHPYMDSGQTGGGGGYTLTTTTTTTTTDGMSSNFSMQPHNVVVNLNNSSLHFNNAAAAVAAASYPLHQQPHQQVMTSENAVNLSQLHLSSTSNCHDPPGPSNSLLLRSLIRPPPITPGQDFLTEEDETRIRNNHDMLDNDDMQHLLRIFNMGQGQGQGQGQGHGHGHGHGHGNGHGDPTYNFNLPAEDNFAFPCAALNTPELSSGFGFGEDGERTPGKAVIGWLKLKAALRWGIFVRKQQAADRRAQLEELDDL